MLIYPSMIYDWKTADFILFDLRINNLRRLFHFLLVDLGLDRSGLVNRNLIVVFLYPVLGLFQAKNNHCFEDCVSEVIIFYDLTKFGCLFISN